MFKKMLNKLFSSSRKRKIMLYSQGYKNGSKAAYSVGFEDGYNMALKDGEKK